MVKISQSAASTLPYLVILKSCEDCSTSCPGTFKVFMDIES
jgi:hypothetical protein